MLGKSELRANQYHFLQHWNFRGVYTNHILD